MIVIITVFVSVVIGNLNQTSPRKQEEVGRSEVGGCWLRRMVIDRVVHGGLTQEGRLRFLLALSVKRH